MFAIGIGATGVACGSPTQPNPAPSQMNLAGTWSGPASDSSGSGQMTWQISQTASVISGTLTMTDAATNITGHGSINGSLSGSLVHFVITVPMGGFDGAFGSCSATVTGDMQASASSMTGTYTGTNSCSGAITAGQVTLTKSG
jgi:hypothetical protein